jgi:hypothetical protein
MYRDSGIAKIDSICKFIATLLGAALDAGSASAAEAKSTPRKRVVERVDSDASDSDSDVICLLSDEDGVAAGGSRFARSCQHCCQPLLFCLIAVSAAWYALC